nr:HupE/UreJ family protein [uncultured Massilia sp.]
MKSLHKAALLAAVLATGLALALPAAAHPGHGVESGFAAGFLHPLTGFDHLLALLAVGLWSRQQRQGAVLAPSFLVMMALGASCAGFLVLPLLETSIAATVLLLGAVAACAPSVQARVPRELAVLTVGACAFLHGLAHGRELAGMASGAGFILASYLVMAASAMLPGPRLRRLFGAAIGAAGLCLLAVGG